MFGKNSNIFTLLKNVISFNITLMSQNIITTCLIYLKNHSYLTKHGAFAWNLMLRWSFNYCKLYSQCSLSKLVVPKYTIKCSVELRSGEFSGQSNTIFLTILYSVAPAYSFSLIKTIYSLCHSSLFAGS